MAAKSAIKKHAKQLPLTSGEAMGAAALIASGADANVSDMAAMADPDVAREVVENGYEPPALDNEPAETANFTPREREAEPLEVRTKATQNTPPRAAQAEAGKPAQGATSAAPASTGEYAATYESVAKALRDAKSLDALDTAAD